jgi:uncharacterized delta-60 repeat protein
MRMNGGLSWTVRYGWLGALALVPVVMPGCGDDDTGAGPTGGSGGTAGAGTTNAGTAGSSTSGGAAGTGSATAGAGGAASGSGGATAGSGGGGGSTPDAGTDGPEGGTGPTPIIVPIAAGRHARFFNVTYNAAGAIYAVGQTGDAADPEDMSIFVAKLLPSGALDATFGANGIAVKNVAVAKANEIARGIVVQQDGKIVVSGSVERAAPTDPTRDLFAVRLLENGMVDTTFGTAGVVRLPLGSGELVQQWGLSRFDNDDLLIVGARKQTPAVLDAAPPGDGSASDAAAEGSTGDGGAPPSRNEFAVVRLKASNGAPDPTFGPSGDGVFGLGLATNISPRTATILPDGKILVSGYTNSGGNKPIVFKLTAVGALDPTFASSGIWFPESGIPGFGAGGGAEAYGAVLQGDKLVTGGYGRESSTQPANGFISFRLNADGSLDSTYGTNGHLFLNINDQAANARTLTVLGDRRTLLAGGGLPPRASADAGSSAAFAAYAIFTENGQLDPSNPQGARLYDLGGPSTGRAAHQFWGVALSPDKKNVALVGIKGGVTGSADAGIAAGTDQAAFLLVPTGN